MLLAFVLAFSLAAPTTAYADDGNSSGFDPLGAIASFFGVNTQAEEGRWASDPDTHDDWYSGENGISTGDNSGDSTRNTGRIWTDKSVYTSNVELTSASGENTFTIENDEGTALVGLSALSSAANISGQTTINQPLDIVLVLDVSGSMDNNLSSGWVYGATYDIRESGWDAPTYYVQNENGTYSEVSRITTGDWWDPRFDHWEVNGQRVEPMTSAQDTNSGHVQFYTRNWQSMSKMDALKNAVNGFISATGVENADISNPANQHRISLVKFAGPYTQYAIGDDTYRDGGNTYNYTQVVSDFSTDTTALTNAVNGLDAAGATSADYGFELADAVMTGGSHGSGGNSATYTGARDSAQKVVIFFTDGDPNHGNGFDGSVAASSIDTAYSLKQNDTTVYSIGVMSGADPSDTNTDFNRYMNAVSSNYPSAQANGNWNSLQLGDRVSAEDQYYYAADSSESLNSIFEAIRDSFGSGATSPIESTDTIGGDSVGYLTFTDTLGDYTEVKNFKSIVFAGQEFEQKSSETSADGTSTTYTFGGRVNNGTGEGIVYPGEHNLSDIEITVTSGATAQQGDTVTVRIPSTMIPMRLYTAESSTVDGETTTETSVLPAYPIRVYYTVGMKDGLVDASGNLDASQIDNNYIATHTDADGNVYFYSNDYDGNNVGTTTASFTPATTNSFYYFTQDTPLYASESTDNPARDYNPGSTYYYQRTYYANDEMHTEWVSITAARGQLDTYVYRADDGTYYIEQGSPRLTRATEFEAVKDQNTTETATASISPQWNGTQVIVTLGNNGKIAYPISGDLQIAKTVDWGTTGAEHNDKDFTYTVDLAGTDTAIEGSFDYIKYNAQGQPLDANGDPQQVAEGAEPAATGQIADGGTLTLKNDERVVISGLPANTGFTVTENTEAGYTASNTVEGTISANGTIATGTIVSNDTIDVAYTNTYAVTPTNLADGSIHGTKVLTGRDWKDGESFTFTLSAVTPNTPLPENTSVTLTNGNGNNYTENQQVAFDFGSIQYSAVGRYIYTIQETEGTEYGLTYSNAIYRITVNVADDGAGNLTANIESMYRTFNDDGTSTGQDESQWPSVEDRNAVFANNFLGNDVGIANITGTKSFTDYTSGTTLDINDFQFTITAVTPGAPMPAETQVGNSGTGGVTFADIQFGIDDIGNTYEYDIREVIPQGATISEDGTTATLDGMTYDNTVKRVSIAVTQDQSTGNVVATVTGNGFQFTNSYRASSVTTEGAADGLQITKQLDGAAGAEGQFEFTMVAANDETQTAIANGWVTGIDADGNVKASPAIAKDGSATILFDNLTFTHPGTYTFDVTETQNAPNTAWTYDAHTYQVTFTVTDENGQLVIADPVRTSGSATFTNIYEASMNYDSEAGGILFSKTLNGYTLAANQFNFTVNTPEGDAASAEKLAEATMTLSNRYGAADGAAALWRGIAGLTFDQDDAGQTYTFIVSETNDGAAGYTYDDKPVTIQITVNDDGDGSMSTVTTVTKQDGQSVAYNSENFVRGDASTYPTAVFVNSYDAADADPVSVNFEKQLTGRDWKDTDSFEFTLTPNNGSSQDVTSDDLSAAMPDTTTATVSGTDVDKAFSFGEFTFTKAGTYAYNVVETQPAEGTDTAGVAYDTSTAVVTFTVTDPGTGKLQVSTRITGVPLNNDTGAGVFVNTYTYTPATLEQNTDTGIGVQKAVTGAPNTEDFNFTANFNADASAPAAGEDGVAGSAENIEGLTDGKLTTAISDNFEAGETKAADFGTVTFKAPGVYVFDVTEDNTTTAAGWAYDDSTKQIVVTVTDNTEGELVASVEGNDPLFTNSYTAGSISTDVNNGIKVQKTLDGRAWQEGDSFKFVLEAVDNAPMPADGGDVVTITNTSDPKSATFGSITYDQAGEYKYTVKETVPADADKLGGVIYDTHTTNVTVTITDKDYDGFLEVDSIAYDNNTEGAAEADKALTNIAAFTNVYDAGSTDVDTGKADFQLTKVLEGKAWNGDKFTFKIEAVSNTAGIEVAAQPMPAQTEIAIDKATGKDVDDNDQATFSFGKITYDTPGTYVYKVTEVSGDNGGITYSTNEATITVTVTDNNDGTYTTGVTVANNVFTNAYATELNYHTGGGLEIVKTFIGHDMDEFKFTVTPKDAADGSTTAQDAADKLNIDVSGKEVRTKAESGSETEVGGVPASVAEVAVLDTADKAKFTQADEGKTYTYEVKEMPGIQNGVTYDDTVYTVTITTEDDGIGGITVTTTVTSDEGTSQAYTYDNNNQTIDQTAQVPFSNSYQASGELGGSGDVSINATKTLTNRPMTDGEFTFNVYNTADQDKKTVSTGTNDTDGLITFGAIKYDVQQMLKDVEAGLATAGTDDEGRDTYTYNYMVEEDAGNFVNGVSGVTTSFPVAVTVTDNNDGTLGIAVDYGNSDSLTFENAYGTSANAELNVNGMKVLETGEGADNVPDITGKYTFTISGTADDGMEAPLPEKTETTNNSAGNVDFGKISYTMQNVFGDDGTDTTAVEDEAATDESGQTQSGETEDGATDAAAETTDVAGEINNEGIDLQSAERTKTFTYTVTETGTVDGVDNDPEATKTFTVTVTDNGNGTISVESDPEGTKFRFTNTYNVDPKDSSPTGEGGITITKNLDGRNLNDGEFAFELVDQNGTAVATGANDANGNVELGTVKFTEPGKFTYTIREVKGSLGGVDYDTVQYKATATVTDNGDGTLKVEWSFTDAQGNPLGENASITFNNTYTAQPTSVSLGTGKLIEGRALAAGEFTFKLADADGNEISTATNEENGAVTFDTITYDTPGDYTYTITEVAPQDTDPFTDGIQNNGVTYDESVYNATVKVTDNGKGNLTAQITYSTEDGTAPLFVNTYTASAEPEQGTDDGGLFGMAKTGDFMGGMMAVIAAVIAAAAGGAAYAARKMRRPRGRHAR